MRATLAANTVLIYPAVGGRGRVIDGRGGSAAAVHNAQDCSFAAPREA